MRIGSGSTLTKAIVIAAVALILLVPLHMLRGLVTERSHMRERAVEQVARGWGGRQMIGGPVLAIPVTIRQGTQTAVTRDWYVLPESLDLRVDIGVQEERRSLGVYEVPVYVAKVRATGWFDAAREMRRLAAGDESIRFHTDRARLLVPVYDPRGLRDVQHLKNDLVSARLEPSRDFAIPVLAAPVSADAAVDNGERKFDLLLEVAGTESLAFLPLARSVSAEVTGNWPHPGFTHGFLPVEHRIADGGFRARWKILDLNRSYGGSWFQGALGLPELQASAFGVELVQPVDLYQRAHRAVKYAGLFIAMTLLTMFLWEHLARRQLHPVQYGLTGMALSVFYLLLLALAEHVGFPVAYLLAAVALCTLLAVYLSGALRSRKVGGTSGGLFALVYALLYLLVTSEDYALLVGALALFAVLATVMLLTRRIDWYSFDTQLAAASEEASPSQGMSPDRDLSRG